jgi:hypothetical protein
VCVALCVPASHLHTLCVLQTFDIESALYTDIAKVLHCPRSTWQAGSAYHMHPAPDARVGLCLYAFGILWILHMLHLPLVMRLAGHNQSCRQRADAVSARILHIVGYLQKGLYLGHILRETRPDTE